MGKEDILQRTLGFADDAGDAVRALVADEGLFSAFRKPEVFRNLPPHLQRKVLANDPSAISELMSVGRARASVDDVAARATPAVEIPYANEGVGRREAPLDASSDWTNGSDSARVGYPGPGVMQFPPPAVVNGERGLTVIDAAPTPGAGRVDRVFDVIPGESGVTALSIPGLRGRGTPVDMFGGPGRGLAVVQPRSTPLDFTDLFGAPPAAPERTAAGLDLSELFGAARTPGDPSDLTDLFGASPRSSQTRNGVNFTDLFSTGPKASATPGVGMTLPGSQPPAFRRSAALQGENPPSARRMALAGAGAVGALTAGGIAADSYFGGAPEPVPTRGPRPSDPVSILINMGLTPSRAKALTQDPEVMSSRERAMIQGLPPATQELIFQR